MEPPGKLSGLDEGLLVQILSFVDLSDLFMVSQIFPTAVVQSSLNHHTSLSFSTLLQRFPNTLSGGEQQQQQQNAVSFLVQQTTANNHFGYLDFNGLRNVSGAQWLPSLSRLQNLHTLDLRGCASLDPQYLLSFLNNASTTGSNQQSSSATRSRLKHLLLDGCSRLGPEVVLAIGDTQSELISLSIAGCSNAIKDQHVLPTFQKLHQLEHLNLQGLTKLTDALLLSRQRSFFTLKSLNIGGCEKMRLQSPQSQQILRWRRTGQAWNAAPQFHQQRLANLYLDGLGTPRRGLYPGALTYYALGQVLKEVSLGGCEHVQDWELESLAELCGLTLTYFKITCAHAISNNALVALGTHCDLTECDITYCKKVDDDGVIALCRGGRAESHHRDGDSFTRPCRRSSLRCLKVALLERLSDKCLPSVAMLTNLHVLDVHGCQKITALALSETVVQLPKIIEIVASEIANDGNSLYQLLQKSANLPSSLVFVNKRKIPTSLSLREKGCCCMVSQFAQHLDRKVPLQYMYHCVDCHMIPQLDKGICSSCVSRCHKNHRTFMGSYCRFYCDCPFDMTKCEMVNCPACDNSNACHLLC